jgi:putative transposase
VNDKRVDETTGERKRFSSAILPPWCRKSPKISEVLPLLYLHGLSSGDFVPALEQFLGSSAGLSPATVTRLTTQWQADHKAFCERDLSATDYVYVWADGIHLRIRLEEAKAAVLVVMGVRADGTKELIAMADGYRESSQAWASLLRDCQRRGMHAPVLAVGDGALGFWNASNEVFPETVIKGAGFTKRPTASTASRSRPSPRRRGPSRTSTTPRTASTQPRPSPVRQAVRREVPQSGQGDRR